MAPRRVQIVLALEITTSFRPTDGCGRVHYVPEPRTVFKLAQTFEVSQRRLMQLAGLAAANDAGLRQEAVRFAARSEAVQKLTPEESSALEAFVAVLSEQDPKRAK
jgi:hypothetical protein